MADEKKGVDVYFPELNCSSEERMTAIKVLDHYSNEKNIPKSKRESA
jgi:hypothetical protein